MEEQCVAAEDAAEALGVSLATVHAWQDRGRLLRVDLGGHRMAPREDITRYLQERQERLVWRDTISARQDREDLEEAAEAAAATFTGAIDLTGDAAADPVRSDRAGRRSRH